ncbi:hypothetical protein FZEAL_398 [Fusarium zealandicum]|uniref:Uncharacterized protein n=1 Tax=Fusarium zealandicum TaxID=1053134 RepID=A0A8H4UUV8_9HYPO|nr:hypothetical protein FZEAL_398 [Fusarium zealandicum]
MPRAQLRFVFEYPQLGSDIVSDSPPKVTTSGDGPTFGPDPEACPYEDSEDSEDYDEESQVEDDQGKASWHPRAVHFLSQIPQDDTAWSRHLSTNTDVRSLCHRLRIPFLYPGFQAHLNWSRLFSECTWHLARACNNPPLASLFSLIFVAACHVALVDGCPKETVLEGLKACVRQCGVMEDELTEDMLDRVREGVVTGISILGEYARVVGCRANEIPLHAQGCLELFQRSTPACSSFIKSRIPSTYRPTTPLHSECLEIPALVYDLLGGRHSKWE